MLCFNTIYEKSGKHEYRGIQITAGLKMYISKRVLDRYHDVSGAQKIAERFSALRYTEFDGMDEMLHLKRECDKYSIAETLVECFLEDYAHAKFPYVSARDNKNPKGGQAGADLVGFSYLKDSVYFLFGEVKFSRESKYPPTVIRSKNGLMAQLKNLDHDETKGNLIVWLAQKILQKDDKDNYIQALESYYKDPTKIKIVGALIRTVKPDSRDLHKPFELLTQDMQSQYLEMIAIYVDENDLMLTGDKH